MTTRTPLALRASLALSLSIACAAALPAIAPASTTTAKLRVLTPSKVLDPGTTYLVDDRVSVPTTPEADCFGPPGGSGAEFRFEQPNALSLLATAARTSAKVRPLSLTDQFGFGLGICGIGGADAVPGESFWYLKANREEATVGADQLAIRNGDEILFYLAPDNFPNPNPSELELRAPARAQAGEQFSVKVVEHACVTDPNTFDVSCETQPAAGVSVGGAGPVSKTGADGSAVLAAPSSGSAELAATRGTDIPSEVLEVCVANRLERCPPRRGERVIGSPNGDRIRGTAGSDSIRARRGADEIDLRRGGADALDCGPGRDTVLVGRADRDDRIARDCERVRRR